MTEHSKPESADLRINDCPFCGTAIVHVETWAKSFNPPRLYHEWHHVADNGCIVRTMNYGPIIDTATDDLEMQRKVVARWNARARAQQTRAETAWLIERGETKPEMILYFCFDVVTDKGITIKHWSWTSDNQKATRFGRKIDAELTWQCATQRDLSEVDLVEHMWCSK